ncbi:SAM-dependent methyltransferase [uncultured Cyclobacterium sp.]|uniref:O-methyltransferase n=1 Tax=uncultured Cyclobacterium sp. TaxID=453820 RepID=UPI0030ED11E8|tara:strand:- start:384120 stop:384701 length:582 start_codon:yes stop_codon:yes gene_type:complete
MNQAHFTDIPSTYSRILEKSNEIGFTMPSDLYIGSLLKTLISSKQKANILELGTGIGLSLAWMVDGLNPDSVLTSIDNDPELTKIANGFFGEDRRLSILCEEGENWIINYSGPQFDLVFADAWPGKYSQIDEILSLVKVGGFYIIDDMSFQKNWPIGHAEKAENLIKYLEKREDFNLTKMDWSTGVILMTKIK